MSDDDLRIEQGSDNVFADLGLPDAEERLTKAQLVLQISDAIRSRKLSQAKAAALLSVDQPKISRLLRGQLSGFSTERLIQFLTLLGRDVTIVVRPSGREVRGPGRVSVVSEVPTPSGTAADAAAALVAPSSAQTKTRRALIIG